MSRLGQGNWTPPRSYDNTSASLTVDTKNSADAVGPSHDMSFLPRKVVLAILAVLDVALNTGPRPVAAKVLADRNDLPGRHLEPVLQALVHSGVLKGIRGPRGGYELGRERRKITIYDIVRAVGSVDDGNALPKSPTLHKVVLPAVSSAEAAYAEALKQITLEDMVSRAGGLSKGSRPLSAPFTI